MKYFDMVKKRINIGRLAKTATAIMMALAISMGLSGIAAGAATVGCCAQMVGFAVASYRENKMGGLIAQGLGTSMLQYLIY